MTECARIGAGRKVLFSIVLLGLVVSTILVLGEVLLRAAKPQPYMVPRYQYSDLYGHELPANTVMVAKQPGVYEFHYTINEYGYRGEPVPLSNRYERSNIVVLGDSHSMGVGVEDGDVFSVVMGRELAGCFNVVNLGVGGYGLTHEIRRFYEFGILYQPEVVVVQFFHNDPSDNFQDKITVVEDGRFRFRLTEQETGWLKELLSDSLIQYSQVYNLLRDSAYRIMRRRRLGAALAATADGAQEQVEDKREFFYNELLQAFAHDLDDRGIDVIFIAVNRSLDRFPAIKKKVLELDGDRRFRYLEVVDWFEGVTDYGSPEGHSWGAKAHRIVGENLARVIRVELIGPDAPPECIR